MFERINDQKYSLRCKTLAMYIMLLPLANLKVGSLGSLLKFIALVPITVNILMILKYKKVKINIAHILLILFTILIFISIVYSINTDSTISRSTTYILGTILIFITTSLPYNSKEIKFLKHSIFISGIITAICVICFSGKLENGTRLTLGNGGIFIEDPNYLCGYFIFPLIYSIDRINNKDYKHSNKIIIYIISIVVFTVIVLMTGSRGGLFGIIGSIIAYYLFNLRNISKKNIIRTIVFILFMIIFFSLLIDNIPIELQERFNIENILNSNGTGRFDLWKSAIQMYNESNTFNKILGYGAGTIRYISVNGQSLWNVVHNFWIETLLELGFVGLSVIITCYTSFFILSYKKNDVISMSSIIGFIIMTMSLSLSAFKPLWNIFIISSLIAIHTKSSNNKECIKNQV